MPKWALPTAIAIAVAVVAAIAWWLLAVRPVEVLVEQATSDYSQGRYAEAEKALAEAIDRSPGNISALVQMARVKAATGDSQAALDLYERIVASGGASAEVYYEYALLERVTGHSKTASELLLKAWEADRSKLSYADELGKTYAQVGNDVAAAELYTELATTYAKTDVERKDFRIRAAQAWLQAGESAKAKASLEAALKIAPKDAQALMLMKRVK